VRVLDLFSGIGGFSLGLQMAGGFETVQFCEIDPWCRQVLAKNFRGVPIHDDIRSFQPAAGIADLVVGGFPCQPFSSAGKRAGTQDDRDLWPEMRRVIAAVRPTWVVGENVAGFVNMELDRSLSDLEALGYACQAFVIPACAVDAPHRRDRVWIVGYSSGAGSEARCADGVGTLDGSRGHGVQSARSSSEALAVADAGRLGRKMALQQSGHGGLPGGDRQADESGSGGAPIPDAKRERLERQQPARPATRATDRPGDGGDSGRWSVEPGVGRVANGVPARVDRLRGLGNAVVPQVVAEIGKAIRSVA
jgi:DNA (cytosine-5)-methyltransferase 1